MPHETLTKREPLRSRIDTSPKRQPPAPRTRQLSELHGPGGQLTSLSDHQEHAFHRARYVDRRFSTSR